MSNALSNWKTITVFLDSTPEGENVANHAAELAHHCGAYLVGIHALPSYPDEHPTSTFALGARAVNEVIAEQEADEREEIRAVRHCLQAIAHRHGVASEMRIIQGETTDEDLVAASRCCDLIVLGYPKHPGLPKNWSAGRLLMEIGGPMLIVPTRRETTTIGRNVVVAWNGSREALGAVRDAMPFLTTAHKVTVLIIDPEKSGHKFHKKPGADLSGYLARRSVHARITQLRTQGSSVADAILSAIADQSADLLVIGAYSHARLAEEIFGGVTQTLLSRTTVPLLLSV